MQLIRNIQHFPAASTGCALTIGNFDGVHLGHQAILRHLRQRASELGLPSVVMLFEPQPREYFQAQQAPARLMRLRNKLQHLAKFGVDYVIAVKFDRTFAEKSAQDFIQEWLVNRLNVRFLSIGDDFRFGAKRLGDFSLLQQAGKQFGFQVEDNHSFCLDQLRISSTAIREALATDNLTLAAQMLGRPYCILGRVTRGNQIGRTLGFPTANIALHRQVNPIQGVYVVKVRLQNGNQYQGIANVGKRPTINGITQLLEVHIFDFNQKIYGQFLEVEFCQKIRNEQKFPSLPELTEQIKKDIQQAKAYFQNKNL